MSELGHAYEGMGSAWASGPSQVYDRLARHTVMGFAAELLGASVLDVGAGTGALSRALQGVGATPVALDASADMLRFVDGAALLCVTGDMLALPFLDDAFDAAVSAFAISHLDEPLRALCEMRRVVKPAGLVIASVFGAAPPSAAKDAVDEVTVRFGYEPPAWYRHLKEGTEPLSNTTELLTALASAASLSDVEVADDIVDTVSTPEAAVEYRIGLAHFAPFVASLPAARRAELVRDSVSLLGGRDQPLRARVLTLSSRAPE